MHRYIKFYQMRSFVLLSSFILCVIYTVCGVEPPQPKRRNRNQPNEPAAKHTLEENFADPSIKAQTLYPTSIPNVGQIPSTSNYRSLNDCPSCWASKRNAIQVAIDSYWQNDLKTSFACACNQLSSNPEDGYAQAIIHALTQGKHAPFNVASRVSPPMREAPPIKRWEVLGPINVGKLEHDSDSTFHQPGINEQLAKGSFDPIQFLLGTHFNGSVSSDLCAGGRVKWAAVKANEQGDVRKFHLTVT